MPRTAKQAMSAEAYRALGAEEGVLATLKAYAERFGGFTRHVRQAQGQDLEGLPDCLLWVPAHDRTHECWAPIEVKIGADEVSEAQWAVHRANERIDRVVPAILREGAPPRPGEMSLDQVLARLEEARRWL